MTPQMIMEHINKNYKDAIYVTAVSYTHRDVYKRQALERSDIDIAVSGVKDFDTLSDEVEDLPTLYLSLIHI